nr:unnamed protein product [Callosobruchus chinensis]
MEVGMLAVEDTKIDVDDIKLETTGTCGVQQATWLPDGIKNEEKYTNQIASHRIKNDQNIIEPLSTEEFLDINGEIITLEEYADGQKIGVSRITQDLVLRKENDHNSFVDTDTKIAYNRKQDEEAISKSYNCYHCNYTACDKYQLINHMNGHKREKGAYQHNPESGICIPYNTTFRDLNSDTVRKHPSIRTLECAQCSFRAMTKIALATHTCTKLP